MKQNKLTTLMLENLPIPAQPTILAKFLEKVNDIKCDIADISALVQNDMALSASIIQTVNSPSFNLSNKISSIQHAIILMGLSNLSNLVYCFSIRQSHQNNSPEIEQFWKQSQAIALITTHISQTFSPVDSDEAFSVAFLSNCGVPVLAEQHTSYLDYYLNHSFSPHNSLIKLEDKEYMLDHTVVGYFLAKKWHFPEFLYNGIYYHHSIDIEKDLAQVESPKTRIKLGLCIAALQFAEYIYSKKHDMPTPYCWQHNMNSVLHILSITKNEAESFAAQVPDF